jgi:hypothetical protein
MLVEKNGLLSLPLSSKGGEGNLGCGRRAPRKQRVMRAPTSPLRRKNRNPCCDESGPRSLASARASVPPLLLWRRGLGRGGPASFAIGRYVATFQQVDAPLFMVCWLRRMASSPCPSPPKEERETPAAACEYRVGDRLPHYRPLFPAFSGCPCRIRQVCKNHRSCLIDEAPALQET